MFHYLGREYVTKNSTGQEVLGGSDIVLTKRGSKSLEQFTTDLQIDPATFSVGRQAIARYAVGVRKSGRINVDVLKGKTDSGGSFIGAVDVSARVGGSTPAEVLAIAALHDETMATACHSQVQLMYSPVAAPTSGVQFVASPDLVINACVEGVIQ